jgi:uncharacterized RDD family membrane protein YckC
MPVGITVLKNNVPWGPFTRAQIDEGLERGDFDLSTLAHAPGVKNWLPLEEVLHILEPKLPAVPVTRDLPPVPSADALAKARPPILPVPPKNPVVFPENTPIPEPASSPAKPKPGLWLSPAPFIPRFFAFLIDCAVLFVPILLLMVLSAVTVQIRGWWEHADAESMRQEWALLDRNFHQLLLLVAIGLGWIYAAGLECSRWQATVGKRWMGIQVTDANGDRLGFLQATGRHFGKYLSALPCFLGFMAALFSSRGMAWHDRLTDTRVVRQKEKS